MGKGLAAEMALSKRQKWRSHSGRNSGGTAAGSADDLAGTVAYRNSKGERFEQGLNEVLDHVANHGTHHRGQIVLLLPQAGFAPPVTDLIAWQRATP